MSESPPSTSLGKRGRDGPEGNGDSEMMDDDSRTTLTNDAPAADPAMDDDDDDDVGPMPMPDDGGARKKRKVLPHERLFLEHLPSADRYSKSFMHRDVLNYVTVTKTDFIVTTSVDGHVKLWKKQETGIEFVKHYRAHLQPVVNVSASADGMLFATISDDGTAKVFDVVNFGEWISLTCSADCV
ncbi:hypothetical protein FRC03_004262 [Tulasnella sp. 419]|nr:hypothetical protein FRC03_004262 [Tulasnella sp. 419]